MSAPSDSPSDSQIAELRSACVIGDIGRVEHLLEGWRSQLSPSPILPKHLHSPLAGAIAANKKHVVGFLLEHGAELKPSNITLAMGAHKSPEMFQTFLDYGWDINSNTDMRVPALKFAVNDEPLTRWFLAHGANPAAVGGDAFNILDVAAANSSPVVLDLLIAHGAKLGDSDALHSAAGECEDVPGRVEMIAHLKTDLGVEINSIERSGPPEGRGLGRGTPLHSAVHSGKKDVIRYLLSKGADRDMKSTLGLTPLEFSIAQDLPESEKVLREGASART